jgi:ubiquinone/menaquinone biosynthesis C-methylase UbiE
MDNDKEQEQRILDSFTRQAETFGTVPAHANDAVGQIVVEATDTRPTESVLDVACGPGLLACIYAKTARHVTGVDLVPAMIIKARERQKERGLKNLTWQVGPAAPLPFADGTFDIAVTRYSFHHFTHPEAVVGEMRRVCRPGGRIAVVDVFVSEDREQARLYDRMEMLRDPSHVRALPRADIERLIAQSGLDVTKRFTYQLEMELESQLKVSFPKPGDEELIRRMFQDDLGKNRLGLNIRRVGEEVRFSYPIAGFIARKTL